MSLSRASIFGIVLLVSGCSSNEPPASSEEEESYTEEETYVASEEIAETSEIDITVHNGLIVDYWKSYYISPLKFEDFRLGLDTLDQYFRGESSLHYDPTKTDHLVLCPPELNNAIFQSKDEEYDFTEWDVFFLCRLNAIEQFDHLEDDIFCISVYKDLEMYTASLIFLTYDSNGKLIDWIVTAEYHGDGGYSHTVYADVVSDSLFAMYGEGYDIELEMESEDGDGSFPIDTSYAVLHSNGKFERLKKN